MSTSAALVGVSAEPGDGARPLSAKPAVPPSTLRRLNAKRAGAAVSSQQAQPRKDHLPRDCAAIRFSQFLFFAPFEGRSTGGAEQGTGRGPLVGHSDAGGA